MGWGNHHLDAYDPDIGKTRTFTADELQQARGRSTTPGYRHLSVEDAERMQEAEQRRRITDHQLLEWLVALGNKFRSTPIVDDDFPTQRDNFDMCLAEATEHLRKKRQGNRDAGSSK